MTRYASVYDSAPQRQSTDGSLADAINTHEYPRLLHESGAAFRLFQVLVHLSTLRSWYVRRAIRRALSSVPRGGTIVDVGCGSGDHIMYAGRRRPDVGVVGIDRAEDAVALCKAHGKHLPADAAFMCSDVEERVELPRAGLILCVTMLQYVRDDAALLRKLRAALKDDGRMLLYVPVRNERMLACYPRMVDGGRHDYDAVQERQRIYSPTEIIDLLEGAGFHIARAEQAYGWAGKLSFELHGLLLWGLTQRRLTVKVAALLSSVLALPTIALLMIVDFAAPVRRGNGLLVMAR